MGLLVFGKQIEGEISGNNHDVHRGVVVIAMGSAGSKTWNTFVDQPCYKHNSFSRNIFSYSCRNTSSFLTTLTMAKLLGLKCSIHGIPLNYCNEALTHKHLVRKGTLNHLAKLAKWFSCVVSTYLCGALTVFGPRDPRN